MPATIDLDKIRIASPCPADWNEMRGDERVRFCDSCSLNVYNISEMTADEARELIRTTEGRLCVRLYRRKDGTVITKDCPVGWRAVRWRFVRAAVWILSLLGFSMAAGCASPWQQGDMGSEGMAPMDLPVPESAPTSR